MKKMSKKLLFPLGLLVAPVLVSAQTINSILETVQEIIAIIVPILIALAVVYFLFGVLKYVIAKDPESQKEARSVMIYGIIVLFVMVSIWGLVAVLGRTIGVGDGVGVPTLNLVPGSN